MHNKLHLASEGLTGVAPCRLGQQVGSGSMHNKLHLASERLTGVAPCRLRQQEHEGDALLDGSGGHQADGPWQASRHLERGLHCH